MTKYERKKIIEDFEYVLNSGDDDIISTMKSNLIAYRHCVDVNKRHEELAAEELAAEEELTAALRTCEEIKARLERLENRSSREAMTEII